MDRQGVHIKLKEGQTHSSTELTEFISLFADGDGSLFEIHFLEKERLSEASSVQDVKRDDWTEVMTQDVAWQPGTKVITKLMQGVSWLWVNQDATKSEVLI